MHERNKPAPVIPASIEGIGQSIPVPPPLAASIRVELRSMEQNLLAGIYSARSPYIRDILTSATTYLHNAILAADADTVESHLLDAALYPLDQYLSENQNSSERLYDLNYRDRIKSIRAVLADHAYPKDASDHPITPKAIAALQLPLPTPSQRLYSVHYLLVLLRSRLHTLLARSRRPARSIQPDDIQDLIDYINTIIPTFVEATGINPNRHIDDPDTQSRKD